MKKNILLCIALFSLSGCSDMADKIELTNKCHELSVEANTLQQTTNELNKEIKDLKKLRDLYKSGKPIKYIVKFEMKQSHFSLDLSEHAKDMMNAVEFDMPVSEEFYNNVNKGTDIVDSFRAGSFIVNGSFGSWNLTVIDKRIE